MNDKMMEVLLQAHKKSKLPIKITVAGVSMKPTLKEGDRITVISQENYQIGDILVFRYKHSELLVHRLLDIKEKIYFCKGDNAFRLEDINPDKIFGKVMNATRGDLSLNLGISQEALQLSLQVNKEFVKQRYDIEATKQSELYRQFQAIIKKDKCEM